MGRLPLKMPVRPSIPPVLTCALCLWAACAAVLAYVRECASTTVFVVGVVSLVAACGAGVLLWRRRCATIWCALFGLCIGIACGCAGSADMRVAQRAVGDEPASRMRFEATEDASKSLFGTQCVARTRLEGGRTVEVLLRFEDDVIPLLYGEVFEASVSLAKPTGTSAEYYWQRGVVAMGVARNVEVLQRDDLLGILLSVRGQALTALGSLEGDGAAVLQALVCGGRTALDDTDVYEAFKVTGLAHLVAVSGAHLVIVCAFVGVALKVLHVPRAVFVGTQVLLILCYLVLSAAPVSAVRAALMAVIGMSSFFARRRPSSLNGLAVCIIAVVASSAFAALSVSFALSVLSTLGIVLFARLALTWLEQLVRLPRFAAEALALTIASSIMAQPLSAALFSQMSLVSPLANVLTAPLFPLVCAGGLVASLVAVVSPPFGSLLLNMVRLVADALCEVVRLCAGLPFACVPVALPFVVALGCTVVGAVALWLWWPKPRLLFAGSAAVVATVLAFGMVFVMPSLAGDRIVMLDVGQGDAFLVRSRGVTLLVDTGNQDKLLRQGLARHGVYQLDAIIVTHSDDDHGGSLSSLKGVVRVNSVLLAQDALSCPCKACVSLRCSAESLVGKDGVEGLIAGTSLRAGIFDLRVVWPKTFTEEGGNADSVCLVAQADADGDGISDMTTLFTGDAEHQELTKIVDQGMVSQVDILKVGHHGSKNALTPELIEALSPRVALISVGEGNRYGHPAEKTIQELSAWGVRIERTDEVGDVSCELRKQGIVIN
ncbi:MAG: DNA internalization-related competence protein ComEC/Rec2 [Gordonibacter sp.]|nr:DNA internalization-related competence protein ComEC/Rec2 [Gordonibacter sp.]